MLCMLIARITVVAEALDQDIIGMWCLLFVPAGPSRCLHHP